MEIGTFKELKSVTEDKLITAVNSCLALQGGLALDTRHILEAIVYLEQLSGRKQDSQTHQMLKYTWWITAMTGIVTVATIANLVCLFH